MFLATPPPPTPRTPNPLKGDLLVYWSTVWSEEFLSPHSAEAPTEEEVSHDQNTSRCPCLFPPWSQHKEERLPPQTKPQSVLPNSFCLFNASLMGSTSPQILPLSWTKKGLDNPELDSKSRHITVRPPSGNLYEVPPTPQPSAWDPPRNRPSLNLKLK